MGSLSSKFESVVDITRYYASRPTRLPELRRWARDRGKGTLDLRLPWWNYLAIDAVSSALPAKPVVFEYGGGGSTLWLADRGAVCITVEHEADWARILEGELPEACSVLYRPSTASGSAGSDSTPGEFYDDYVNAIKDAEDNTFDLVIVDGRARVECVRAARSKVKVGGLMLLDDSDRPRYSPALDLLKDWRRKDYKGVKPSGGGPVKSSVWTKLL